MGKGGGWGEKRCLCGEGAFVSIWERIGFVVKGGNIVCVCLGNYIP